MQKSQALLAHSLVDAVKLLATIVNDEQAARRTRLRAAEMILDRVLGRPREQIALDLSADVPAWQKIIASAIVNSAEQIKDSQDDEVKELTDQSSDIVEGEVVDEESPRHDARGRFVKNKRPSVRDEKRSR